MRLLFLTLAFMIFSPHLGAACLTTLSPSVSFIPPAPYDTLPTHVGTFWYGTNELWTRLGVDGRWAGLAPYSSPAGGLRQKVFWWSDGYHWKKDPQPSLIVTAKRLDGDAPNLADAKATNAYSDDIGSAMLTGLDFPTHGCWEVTGHYKGRTLTFVVSIEP